jgi:uncharacterized protein YigA (DUF484 family)
VGSSSDDAAKIHSERLTTETVAAWLRRHPEFLQENPEVLTFLTPPEFRRGERILDMQYFMLERMRDDLTRLRRNEKQLLSMVEGNAAGQSKVHKSVTAIAGSKDIQALNAMIRTKLPAMLDIEAAVMCIEETGALALAGATAIGAGGVANFLGPKQRILLQGQTAGEAFIFGAAADRIKSLAYLRLRTGENAADMLLALGSGREDGFEKQQATDLIIFLADVLEARLKQCLGPKN